MRAAAGSAGTDIAVDHGEGELADGRERPDSSMYAAAVFVHQDVAPRVQPVIDAPNAHG